MMSATKRTPRNEEPEKPSSNFEGTVMSWRYCSSSLSGFAARATASRGMRPAFRENGSLRKRVVMLDAIQRQRAPSQELLPKVVDEGAVAAHPSGRRAVQSFEVDHHFVDAGDVGGACLHREALEDAE